MQSNATFCDFLNHNTFMGIDDKEDYFEITMKSLVCCKGTNEPNFFTDIFGDKVSTYKYHVVFLTKDL